MISLNSEIFRGQLPLSPSIGEHVKLRECGGVSGVEACERLAGLDDERSN